MQLIYNKESRLSWNLIRSANIRCLGNPNNRGGIIAIKWLITRKSPRTAPSISQRCLCVTGMWAIASFSGKREIDWANTISDGAGVKSHASPSESIVLRYLLNHFNSSAVRMQIAMILGRHVHLLSINPSWWEIQQFTRPYFQEIFAA